MDEERVPARRMGPDGMFAAPEDDPREGRPGRGERDTLEGYLRAYRQTLELKCAGLDPEGLAARSVAPSTLSLLGLVRHSANVECHWFRRVIEGRDVVDPFASDVDPDADFNGALANPGCVAEAFGAWHAEIDHAEGVLAGIENLGRRVPWRGEELEVRDIVVHLIEEYARHCGHADLLRERVDGRAGQ
ncbi:MAG TPA: DinB family protein [Acidimicrobiales bacterium]|nr:DinB family protein [Acidimicrobiales bacterium]